MIEGGQNLAPNVPNQPPVPADKKENALKGIIDSDLKKLSDVAGLKNKEDVRQAIKRHIDSILDDYKSSQKTDDDFALIAKRLEILSIGGNFTKLDSYDVDRSWDQDQVNFFIGTFNERAKGNREFYEQTLANPFLFSSAFTTSSKKKKEQNTVSEHVARSAIKLIKSGETLSDALSKELGIWFQNIQMVDMDIRLDMISAFLHNPGRVDRNLTSEMIANQGLYGIALPQQLEELLQKNKQNTNRVLKIVEVLERLYRIDWAGFEDSSEEAGRALQRIKQNSDNYFLKFKLDAVGGRYDFKQRDKTRKLLKEYNQPDLRSTGPIPLERRGWYDQDKFVEMCSYSKVSNKYGVIYNPFDGGIDSFFEIGSPKKENLRLEDIIAREEMSFFTDMKPDEQENLINNYKSLMAVDFRNRIENEFGMEMSSFDIREQLQFVNFLSTKTTQEVEEVRQFLNQGQTSESKNHRIKCFLSLEFGEEMGERILNIGRSLENQPQVADQLFAEYSLMVDEAEKDAEEVCHFYEEIFFEKKLDRSQIAEAILRKGKDLLFDASVDLEKAEPSKGEVIIRELISSLRKQQESQKKTLNDLEDTSDEMRLSCGKIVERLDFDDYAQLFGNPDDYPTPRQLDEAIKSGKIFPWWMDKDFQNKGAKQIQKFDSKVLEGLLLTSQKRIEELQNQLRKSGYDNAEDVKGSVDQIDNRVFKRYRALIDKETQKKANLGNVLVFRKNLERKLEQIIFGQESAVLPKELLANLEQDISETKPERIPLQEPLYFPVGISKDLPNWERVFAGELKAAKPIDIFGYLFWLNNRGRKVELVVCDEMQETNYQVLYGKADAESRDWARRIGQEEKRLYADIINAFGLENIDMVDYRDFRERKKEEIEKYRTLCYTLSRKDALENAFLNMLPSSMGSPEERKKMLPYAIEELSWILATDGAKVSHLGEARYDAVAAVIKNTENYLASIGKDIFNFPNGEGLMPFILESAQFIQNLANERKSKVEKNSAEFNYWKNIHNVVSPSGITRRGKVKIARKIPREKSFNFLCPSVSAQSFGLEDVGGIKKKNVLKFKEPYSTYFVSPEGAELFLDSDQVVAVPEGNVGGKILTMSEGNQRKYAEKVLKPLLVQFFKTLENAPREYFEQVKKTRDELIVECQESATLSDLLKFVQRYVVAPSMKKKAA